MLHIVKHFIEGKQMDNDKPLVHTAFRLPEALIEMLTEMAAEQERPKAEILRRILIRVQKERAAGL